MNKLHRSLITTVPLATLVLGVPAAVAAPIQPLSPPPSMLLGSKGWHGHWGHHQHGNRGLHRGWWIGRGNPHHWR